MKKIMLPVLLVLTLGVGGYFLFLYDAGEPGSQPEGERKDRPYDTRAKEDSLGYEARLRMERQDKRERESEDPSKFLELSFDYRNNILGESVLTGEIKNHAELSSFKEITLRVIFFDKTTEILDSSSQVITETLAPGRDHSFKFKLDSPKGTKAADMKVVSAEIAAQ